MSERVLLTNDFDENELCAGSVLWYVNDDIDNPEPHPHVVVAIHEGFTYTVCGTSQQETIERKARNYGLELALFPAIDPHQTNGLRRRTFFDCGNYFEIHTNVLQDKYQRGEIVDVSGNVSFGEYDQIRRALRSADTMDIGDLLVHPDDE